MKECSSEKNNESITISDIAKKAGVSVTTVSRVINGSDKVKESTRRNISKIIEEYNYAPNDFARGLMKKKNNTIGLIVQSIRNPFFAELIAGIENVLSLHGFSLLLCDTEYDYRKQNSYLNSLLQRQVGGIVIINQYNIDSEFIAKIAEETYIISVQSKISNCDVISCDRVHGMYMAADYLAKQQHKKIAFICFNRCGCVDKYDGFVKALEDNGVPVREEYLIEYSRMKISKNDEMRDPGYLMTKKLLQSSDPPTAIQAMNDFYAIGAYHAVMDAGLKIPDDISICGFDNVGIADILNPPLTTVEQFPFEQGKICGELLVQKIVNGKNSIPREILLPTSLIVRSSVAPPKPNR